jgi:hypothetical protein
LNRAVAAAQHGFSATARKINDLTETGVHGTSLAYEYHFLHFPRDDLRLAIHRSPSGFIA